MFLSYRNLERQRLKREKTIETCDADACNAARARFLGLAARSKCFSLILFDAFQVFVSLRIPSP